MLLNSPGVGLDKKNSLFEKRRDTSFTARGANQLLRFSKILPYITARSLHGLLLPNPGVLSENNRIFIFLFGSVQLAFEQSGRLFG